jgi:hypothetical protein
VGVGSDWDADLASSETLGNEHDRRIQGGHRAADLFDEHILGDPIDSEQCVSLFFVRNAGKRAHGGSFAGVQDIATDPAMQLLNRLEQRVRGSHARLER